MMMRRSEFDGNVGKKIGKSILKYINDKIG